MNSTIRSAGILIIGMALAVGWFGCGGDGGEGDAAEILEANGVPQQPSNTINCGGSVTVTQGEGGTINARGGDCALAESEEDEDDEGVSEFPPGADIPRFTTPLPR